MSKIKQALTAMENTPDKAPGVKSYIMCETFDTVVEQGR